MNPSTLADISASVLSFASIYTHVDLLLRHPKNISEGASTELRAELRNIPPLFLQAITALNHATPEHTARNFYRITTLISLHLSHLRAHLDQQLISSLSLVHARSFSLRLAHSRNRIRRALALCKTYCHFPNTTGCRAELRGVSDSLRKLQHGDDIQVGINPFPTKVLRIVAKVRSALISKDEICRLTEAEFEDFDRAGGLQGLLLHSRNRDVQSCCPFGVSYDPVQLQALKCLKVLVVGDGQYTVLAKVKICKNDAEAVLGALIGGCTRAEVTAEAVSLMRELMRNNSFFDFRKASQPGAVNALLKLLFYDRGDGDVLLGDVIGVLWEFASATTKLRHKMIKQCHGLCRRIVEIIRVSKDSRTLFCGGALLQNLCIDAKIRAEFLSVEDLPDTVWELLELAAGVSNSSALKNDTVTGFAVSMLDSGVEENLIQGLDLLLRSELSVLAASEGAVKRLLDVIMGRHTDEVLVRATEALYVATADWYAFGTCHVRATERLVELLGDGYSDVVRAQTVRVLDIMSVHVGMRERLRSVPRWLEKVYTVTRHPQSAVQAAAASLLTLMGNHDVKTKGEIAGMNGLALRLAEMVESASTEVAEKAAGVVMCLTQNAQCRKRMMMICAEQLVVGLLRLVESTTQSVVVNAAGALYNVTVNPENVQHVRHHPRAAKIAVEGLVRHAGGTACTDYLVGVVGNFGLLDDLRTEMRELGALSVLRRLLRGLPTGASPLRAQVKRAIHNLSV